MHEIPSLKLLVRGVQENSPSPQRKDNKGSYFFLWLPPRIWRQDPVAEARCALDTGLREVELKLTQRSHPRGVGLIVESDQAMQIFKGEEQPAVLPTQ